MAEKRNNNNNKINNKTNNNQEESSSGNNNSNSFLYNTLGMGNNKGNRGGRNNNKNMNQNNQNKNNLAKNEWSVFKNASGNTFSAVQNSWQGAPLPIRFGYLFVFGCLLYYFTVIQYNLYATITITVLMAFALMMTSIFLAIAFIIMMLAVIFLNYKYRVSVEGYIVPTTDITKSGDTYKVFDGQKNHQYVDGQTLPPELTIGSYAYSFWLYVNKPEDGGVYRQDDWKSVFYRGSAMDETSTISNLVQYPGVWIKPDNTTLAIAFQQPGTTMVETVEIPSIEYGQWNHYVILCNPNVVSVYKNKKLEVTSTLKQTPFSMSNYGIFVTSDSMSAQSDDIGKNTVDPRAEDEEYPGTGFAGKLAYVTLHQIPLTPTDIENVYAYHKDKVDTYVAYTDKMIPTEASPPLLG